MKKRLIFLMSVLFVLTFGVSIKQPAMVCYAQEDDSDYDDDDDYEEDDEEDDYDDEDDDDEEEDELYEEGDEIVTSNKYVYEVLSWNESKGNGTVAFCGAGKKTVKSIKIPATVSDYGYSFKVIAIEEEACQDYKQLQTVQIADNVQTIKEDAFKNCQKLRSITIGTGLKKIEAKAFYGDKNLKTITINSKKLTSVGKNAFRNIKKTCVVKAPAKKLAAYQKLFLKGGATHKVTFKK